MLPPEVRVVEMTTDDAWMRDVGPTFVVDGRGGRRGVDWVFNAWGGTEGGLYWPWKNDDEVAAQGARGRARRPLPRAARPRGRLDPRRRRGHRAHDRGVPAQPATATRRSRASGSRRYLHAYLGVEKVLWLGPGTFNDETDGHVDNICCFVRPGVVALHWTDDASDPQHAISARRARAAGGDDRRPRARARGAPAADARAAGADRGGGGGDRRRSAASKTRLRGRPPRRARTSTTTSPTSGSSCRCSTSAPTTRRGRSSPALYPEREVVGVPTREVLLGGGNIHCITQQVPRA